MDVRTYLQNICTQSIASEARRGDVVQVSGELEKEWIFRSVVIHKIRSIPIELVDQPIHHFYYLFCSREQASKR